MCSYKARINKFDSLFLNSVQSLGITAMSMESVISFSQESSNGLCLLSPIVVQSGILTIFRRAFFFANSDWNS